MWRSPPTCSKKRSLSRTRRCKPRRRIRSCSSRWTANKFQKRVVKLGLEHQGSVQVLEGVKAGEKVVTDGSFILKSEMLKGEMEAD